MRNIFCTKPGEAFFATSDIGWVVGHSYIVYGPLINGSTTLLYEGVPTRPDPGIWWRLVERYKVTTMFSAPTALRLLRQQHPAHLSSANLDSLRMLFLAGEPLDESTSRWIGEAIDKPVIDNYWQTETGWPVLALANGVERQPARAGSPGVPMYGYDVMLMDPDSGHEITREGEKGILAIAHPLPPGCMQTVWGDDRRFADGYWRVIGGRHFYNTFDYAVREEDGFYRILGRSDDVINVAGHRLGTREIEECINAHPEIAESAVVGVEDGLKGQVPVAFMVARDRDLIGEDRKRLCASVASDIASRLGAIARPSRVVIVEALPKTRSGKILRRVLQALSADRDPGDLSTLDDPNALTALQGALKQSTLR
jgi:propionyl-CoA synthetase